MICELENKMVVDSYWKDDEPEKVAAEEPKEKGYRRFLGDEFVPEEDAYEYALEKCMGEENEEFRKMLVEWYFSGNWVEEERVC